VAQTRIVFLIGNYGTGGKERQLTEIIRGLPNKSYNIHLFMKCVCSHYVDRIRDHLSSSYSLEKDHFGLLDIFVLRRYLKVVQPDVVFSFSTTLSHLALMINLFGGLRYRLINGAIRDAPIEFSLHLALERVLFKFYKEVIANSWAGLRAYKQHNKKSRYVLYNGYDDIRTPEKSKIELRKQLGIDDKFTVTMVASMGASKDQPTFIKAVAKVLETNNDIQFFLVGDGPRKSEYLALVSSLGFEKDIFFTGEVSNVEEYLKGSDLSVLMSTNAEGFPNVVLESLACGTPVIATDNGGTKEILKDNVNGYIINNGDYRVLAQRILFLKNNNNIVKDFVANGKKLVQTKFSQTCMIQSLESILDDSYNDKTKFQINDNI
jgi:glycosyltransferase involved in cell wall biosynthesis